MAKGGFSKYIKKAFLYRRNLMVLGMGFAVGLISGKPDIILPLLAVGEVIFLAALISRPRFRDAIDAAELKKEKSQRELESTRKANHMLYSLKREDRNQFKELKNSCLKLQQISSGMKGERYSKSGIMSDFHDGAVNNMLWLFLRLLYSKNMLEKFFDTIDEKEIIGDIESAKRRIEEIGPQLEDTEEEIKRRKLLDDTLETAEARLDNYRKAVENHDLIKLEIERLSTKISRLSEKSVNWRDSDSITIEVDGVTDSVKQTEKAIGELDFVSELEPLDDATPSLLSRSPRMIFNKR